MKQRLEPTAPHGGDAFLEPITVARGLEAALRLLEQSEDLQQVMGHRFSRAYCAVKREEFEAFNKVISSWEREYLMLNV
jgi:glutamine synthetase